MMNEEILSKYYRFLGRNFQCLGVVKKALSSLNKIEDG